VIKRLSWAKTSFNHPSLGSFGLNASAAWRRTLISSSDHWERYSLNFCRIKFQRSKIASFCMIFIKGSSLRLTHVNIGYVKRRWKSTLLTFQFEASEHPLVSAMFWPGTNYLVTPGIDISSFSIASGRGGDADSFLLARSKRTWKSHVVWLHKMVFIGIVNEIFPSSESPVIMTSFFPF
jgi:hypothetical protein